MPFQSYLNKAKSKLEDLNRQHNILPFGQSQGGQAPLPQQHHQPYPGGYQQPPYQQQQQYPYQQPYQQQQQYPYQQQPQQQQQQQQQQHYGPPPGQDQGAPPPPVPMNSRPGDPNQQGAPPPPPPPPPSSRPEDRAPAPQPGPSDYWRASFHPSAPVSQEWHQEVGNGVNGWGNAELEHYTSSPANSFYTPDNKLVLRAIAQPNHPDHAQKYTSARLVSHQTLGRTRGVLTTWLSMPCAEGIWPAFWLLPKEPMTWPVDGEIDIAESWNGDQENHSCLHWGFYNAEDHHKHLVRGTKIPDMHTGRAIRFDFVWDCEGRNGENGGRERGGRLMWYVDGRPVMKNLMPEGTRRIEDWNVIINVAMGGNVCQGKTPREGSYDMIVHEVRFCNELEGGGWGRFEADWQHCPDGGLM